MGLLQRLLQPVRRFLLRELCSGPAPFLAVLLGSLSGTNSSAASWPCRVEAAASPSLE